HPESGRDPNVMALVQDADVMVYDAMFADAAYPRFKGWGHSTWEEAIRIAEAANVKRPVLFHHDPNADDAALDAVAAAAAARYPGALVAKEGETLTL
ncbi:MAG TPA: MBL fold metallo-hydrolase, partial [Alphaproteobacteria bacterium]|nr:MBL fold metallo-hydrolase [Alphaproteobacteria bacterium]